MVIYYRFASSTTVMYLHGVKGLMRKRDFAEWVRNHHNLKRVEVDTEEEYIRPYTEMVVRNVPLGWRPTGLPPLGWRPPPPSPEVVRIETPGIDPEVEFGGDPYAARPQKGTGMYCTQQPVVGLDYFSNGDFLKGYF